MAIQSDNPPDIITIDEWQGLNQQSPRASIGDKEEWWNENFYAIGKGNLRTLWGPSEPIYRAPPGVIIRRIFFGFYGNQTPPFGAPPPGRMGWMFLDNGNIDEVDLDTQQVTTIPNVWLPTPFSWASAKVWRPRFVGNEPGEIGGVLFGSPLGLFAWDGTTLSGPGDPAPDWLTSADTTGLGPFTMPEGLPGIYAMEVFQERLWVAGKNVLAWSAPQNGADFLPDDGGGAMGYFGDKLVWSYMDLQASAGYMYVFGDSSTDLVSNVQLSGAGTTASPLTTQFNYSNVDPQIGHGFPRPVGRWRRYFTTCNGIQVGSGDIAISDTTPVVGRGTINLLRGGEYQSISDKISQLYASVDIGLIFPTFACASIFGETVQLLNGRFEDPFGVERTLLLVWHGADTSDQKSSFWSIATQGIELTEINQYEENSIIAPYGTDGTYLYRLFRRPDPTLVKRLCTKSYRGPANDPSGLSISQWRRVFMEMHDHFGAGVEVRGEMVTRGGGVPNGAESVAFEIPPGKLHDIVAWPLASMGIEAEMNLQSYSPDFTIERIDGMKEDRTLFGA